MLELGIRLELWLQLGPEREAGTRAGAGLVAGAGAGLTYRARTPGLTWPPPGGHHLPAAAA